MNPKQKQQLAAWNQSREVSALLNQLREKAEVVLAQAYARNQMPSEFDDLLEKLDIEATKGQKTRPTALVLALSEIIPFHPQTIKGRLRLLQRRRESLEIDSTYERKRSQFLLFIKQWAESNNGKPKWTTETKLRMAEIYHMLENRVEKDNQLLKTERVDSVLDFDTEFSNLTSLVLPCFAPGALTIMDLQQEFQSAAHDEELNEEEKEEEKEEEEAVITTIDPADQVPSSRSQELQSPMHSPKMERSRSKHDDKSFCGGLE